MKLILSDGQSLKFKNYFKQLSTEYSFEFDYSGYKDILFSFTEKNNSIHTEAHLFSTGKNITDYDGVYFKSYEFRPDIAYAFACILNYYGIKYIDKEVGMAISSSKLSMYTKLALANLSIPDTYAGHTKALKTGLNNGYINFNNQKKVLKRADADRGIDNYLVNSNKEIEAILDSKPLSIWLLQDYIENDGYYRIMIYGQEAKVAIFRKLMPRPDKNKMKAHMYRPKGGENATLVNISDLNDDIIQISKKAAKTMNRQIAGVDVLIGKKNQKVYLMEVNYNPELVNLSAFKKEREDALVDYLRKF